MPGLHGTGRRGVEDFFDRVHEQDRARVRQTLQQVVHDGRPGEQQYRILLEDGSVWHVHERCQAVAGASGSLPEVVHEVLGLAGGTLQKQRVALRLELNPALPVLWVTGRRSSRC